MTFPDFDNIDLAILAILALSISALIIGQVEESLLGTAVAAIAGLAKGKSSS